MVMVRRCGDILSRPTARLTALVEGEIFAPDLREHPTAESRSGTIIGLVIHSACPTDSLILFVFGKICLENINPNAGIEVVWSK